MSKSPRMPFPSFTLVLSRQETSDNESIQERNASNVEPLVDLMVSFLDCAYMFFFLSFLFLFFFFGFRTY